jgi:riboflavin kinase/FMN adenylyltransferase
LRIFHHINDFIGCNNPVVTLGTFDGLHYGHLQIIEKLKKAAKEINGETVVITFSPHPRLVLFPDDNDLKLLSDQDEKIKLFENTGIDYLIMHPFTKEFSRLSTVEFVRDLLVNKLGTKKLIIGYDHRFGRNREGSLEQLKEFESVYGFEVLEIPKQEVDHIAVSSTKIRNALLAGEIKTANSFLGYPYHLTGTVIRGSKLGREIGFPTANLKIEDKHKLIPANGVYAIKAEIGGNVYTGMMNIGVRPTVDGKTLAIEAHLFNFSKDIYDKKISVYFIDKLREEQKFDSIDKLRKQLLEDREFALEILDQIK